jgi:heptosyltransferase-2
LASMPSFARKRRLDTSLGGPVCAVLNVFVRLLGILLHRDHTLTAPPRRVLIIKLVGLGSIIHATPLLQAVREKWPAAPLDFLCFREAEDLVRRLPGVDEVIVLDDRSYLRLLLSVLRFLGRNLRHRPDLVIDLEVHSKFSTILSTLTAARDRAGYDLITVRFRRWLYTHRVYYNRLRHVQEAYQALGQALGLNPATGQPLAPRVSDDEQAAAQRLMEEWGGRRLLVVNVNAGELCLERRWPGEAFARLMELFAACPDVQVVLTGSPGEREYVESVRALVAEGLRERVANVAGRISFGEYLALLARAEAAVTNDSGPLHLAVSVGVPTVSLWGPVLPETFRPLGGPHRVIWEPLYCSPCLHWVEEPPCGGDNRCMKRIPWQRVVREVAELMPVDAELPPVPPEEEERHRVYLSRVT